MFCGEIILPITPPEQNGELIDRLPPGDRRHLPILVDVAQAR
jgi:hypothetical protein